MNIYLFGKTSLSGEVFITYLIKKNKNFYSFSREDKNCYAFNLRESKIIFIN